MIWACIIHQFYCGPEDRSTSLVELLEERYPGMRVWLSHLKYIVLRHKENEDILGIPEINQVFRSSTTYIKEISEGISKGETIDFAKKYFEVGAKLKGGS